MARLNPIDPKSATGKSAELFAKVKSGLGLVPNMTRVMANSPAALEAYLAFSGALAGGRLAPRIREQLALVVAEANECGYCLSAHSAIGKKVGLSAEQIAASRQGEASDPKAAGALRFAKAIVDGRGEVTDGDFAAAREAGLDDAEIAEVITHVALNVLTNYFNKAAETEVDFPQVRPGVFAGV